MAVCQNLVPLVNIKIAGKWMFIPLKMVLIGIDPYPDDFPHEILIFLPPKRCFNGAEAISRDRYAERCERLDCFSNDAESRGYPLVNIQKTVENHHFQWVNPLFLWPFSIASAITRGYSLPKWPVRLVGFLSKGLGMPLRFEHSSGRIKD